MITLGQHAAAKDQPDAQFPASGQQLVGVGGPLPGVNRYANQVGVFLFSNCGDHLRRIEAPEIDDLIAVPDEEPADRHRADLVLVQAEGADDDPTGTVIAGNGRASRLRLADLACHCRILGGCLFAAYSNGSPGSPRPTRRQPVISPMVASASSAATIGSIKSAAASAAALRTRSRLACSGPDGRDGRHARMRSTCA